MNSEIGNKRLMRALANALQIQDVKQFPGVLEVDSVKVVAGLDIGSMALEPFSVNTSSFELSPETGVTWECVGDGLATFPNTEVLMRDPNKNVVITGIQIAIDYDAAGIAADVAAGMSVSLSLFQGVVVGLAAIYRTCGKVSSFYLARAGQENYEWTFPVFESNERDAARTIITSSYNGSIFVPGENIFAVGITRDILSGFPANTKFFGSVFGYTVPKGCKIPWM